MNYRICPVLLTLATWSCATTMDAPDVDVVTGGPTPHTRSVAQGVERPGDVSDLDFLVGRWTGEAFGGQIEEVWHPAMGGQMIGTFRLIQDGAPAFSEHMLITNPLDGVVLRLKHFNPDMTGWEEKDEFVEFPLVAVDLEDSTAWFGGLTLKRSGDRLVIYLAMTTAGGAREEVMQLRRRSL